MRRIYKPQNVTTSEKVILLGGLDEDIDEIDPLGDKAPAEEDELPDTVMLPASDEPAAEASSEAENGDIGSGDDAKADTAAEAPRKKKTQNLHSRTFIQEVQQLEELKNQMIERAASESARLIEEGHARAQAEYNESVRRAKETIESQCEAAAQKGHSDALKEHSQAIESCIQGIKDAICRMESAQAAFITGYESDVKWLALEIAQKVLMDTIRVDETRLVPLVLEAINSAKNAEWMSVELSESVSGMMTKLQEELKNVPYAEKVEIKMVPAPPDTCIVETPDRFLDASVSQQIENLKDYFKTEPGNYS